MPTSRRSEALHIHPPITFLSSYGRDRYTHLTPGPCDGLISAVISCFHSVACPSLAGPTTLGPFISTSHALQTPCFFHVCLLYLRSFICSSANRRMSGQSQPPPRMPTTQQTAAPRLRSSSPPTRSRGCVMVSISTRNTHVFSHMYDTSITRRTTAGLNVSVCR